ncbi:ferredoxin reductase family protein [Pseudonocardia humida]|uniref:Ferredoxin reductase family protein n=1 Tax=Pseudonocardia humida TaxID=2800819 RepID=A0ABT1A3U6_9PSEU|nr:ferredoxin reductase family protein [Pseudonocardia humida]MCO1657620.1 ferredoxin reductase family protein [Pseudonocardia humida]
MRRDRIGPAVTAALPLLSGALWAGFPPPDDGRPGYARQVVGEALGSTAALLFAAALVLATRARWLEGLFGGLDRVYRAHRRAGQCGFALLAGHVAAVPWTGSSPGGTPSGLLAGAGFLVLVLLCAIPTLRYGAWRRSHRLVGVFFVVSLAHALLVDSLVDTAPGPFLLQWAAYGAGIAAYAYTLLVARFVRPRRSYLVRAVRRLDPATVEVVLAPRLRRRLSFRPGQFVFVTLHQRGLREPHPFTVSSAPSEDVLRLTIRSAGRFTSRVHGELEPGRRATVEGGYGMLDHTRGRSRQVWVAGGIGITPFLSWLRSGPGDRSVDLFHAVSRPEDALFRDEIEGHAGEHLRVHHVVTSASGRLTAERIAAVVGPLDGVDVFLCGPEPMTASLAAGFRRLGVPATAIHRELATFR